jgi:hypothetical protein
MFYLPIVGAVVCVLIMLGIVKICLDVVETEGGAVHGPGH